VLELGRRGTHQDACKRLGDLARQASGLDEIVNGLDLGDTTALTDDIALLLIERAGPRRPADLGAGA